MLGGSPLVGVCTPNGDDWISTLVLRDGRVIRRRFSPGTMSEDEVLRLSLRYSDVTAEQVADATIRRASDASVVSVAVDDHFERLMRRIRG